MNASEQRTKETAQKLNIRIGIQGGHGSFHEIAARKFFGHDNVEVVPCETFNDLFDALEFKMVDCGVMAIENTVAGSIIQNYALLRQSKLSILGEVYLRIEQNLLVLQGQTFEDIKEIHSHPMAIQQCNEFLKPYRRNGVKLIDAIDTALSAKKIKDENLKGIATIASRMAAEMYELTILKESIETNKHNFTRFLIISDDNSIRLIRHKLNPFIDKSSICFTLPHSEGSLSQVLSVLASYKMNLSKIQSLPIVGVEWEYLFYVDLLFDDYQRYNQSLDAIRSLTSNLEILGEYKRG